MLPMEDLTTATIKNRADSTQLNTELIRLEKEKQNELRMVNNEIQRFRARYSKSHFAADSPEASNVKMYETHNPGFCFTRNGTHKGLQSVDKAPSVDFEHLHFLLFTDGEVDIEKILCLHLLSSHETDHLTPPRRPRSNSSKHSPLEQLIERSKDIQDPDAVKEVLPTYVLEVAKGNPKRNLVDERLSARLLVNEKILELILTVLSALEHSNPEKVQQLISLAEDKSGLKRIFLKQHIQDFVMTLKDHSLVNSCSSFILTQPSKWKVNHLEIKTPGGALEDLVRYIRSNVLQFPKRENWIMLDADSKEMCTVEHTPLPARSSGTSTSSTRRRSGNISKKESQKENDDGWRFRRRDVDYIQKNIENINNFRRDSEDEEFPQSKRKTSGNVRREKSDSEAKSKRRVSAGVEERRWSTGTTPRQQSEAVKFHLKQTKCPACMEKWKVPLPSPKVPNLAPKADLHPPTSSIEGVVKTNSRRRLQNLIEQEEFKLQSYDRKYSNAGSSSGQSKARRSINSDSLDLVALNILDLEKIRHEIREKETKKKLENFLGSPV